MAASQRKMRLALGCGRTQVTPDMCSFVKARPSCQSGTFIEYLNIHFCYFKHAQLLSYAVLALWLVVLFYTLGNTAADYFCPRYAFPILTFELESCSGAHHHLLWRGNLTCASPVAYLYFALLQSKLMAHPQMWGHPEKSLLRERKLPSGNVCCFT